mgnify:CR=1 FL=1
MARQTLAVQDIGRSGLDPSYSAADSEGHEFQNNGRVFVHVKNGDGSNHDVTIQTPNTVDGLAISDRTVTVPAGEERMIGSFPPGHYNQSDGNVNVDYSAITGMTIAAFRL